MRVLAIVLITTVSFLAGCTDTEGASPTTDGLVSTAVAATATAEQYLQEEIEHAVRATVEAQSTPVLTPTPIPLTPTGSLLLTTELIKTPVPEPTPPSPAPEDTPTPKPIPPLTVYHPESFRASWNWHLDNNDPYFGSESPAYQEAYREEQYPYVYLSYRLVIAGNYSGLTFTQYVISKSVVAGRLVNYERTLRAALGVLISNGKWLGADESISAYLERHKFEGESVDLAGFFSNNAEVGVLLQTLEHSTEIEINAFLASNPNVLLAQEFARRDFDW